MTVDRRRAWECAYNLLNDHREMLRPRGYAMCVAALSTPPEKLTLRRATAVMALHAKLLQVGVYPDGPY